MTRHRSALDAFEGGWRVAAECCPVWRQLLSQRTGHMALTHVLKGRINTLERCHYSCRVLIPSLHISKQASKQQSNGGVDAVHRMTASGQRTFLLK